MKKDPRKSSVPHSASPAARACLRRNRPRKKGAPSLLTAVSVQSSFFAARRKAAKSRRLRRQVKAVSDSQVRSQKARSRAPHRFSTRSGKAASTRTHTCPRSRFTI